MASQSGANSSTSRGPPADANGAPDRSNDGSDSECENWFDDSAIIDIEYKCDRLVGFNLGDRLHPVEDDEASAEPSPKRNKADYNFSFKRLQEAAFIQKLKKSWVEDTEMNTEVAVLMTDPFKVCIVDEFFDDDACLTELKKTFHQLEWHKRCMDLYEFFQSSDLLHMKEDILVQFRAFLEQKVMPWMNEITCKELVKVSATCSFYSDTDYLLTHDDLQSDRAIAFIFYLTEVIWKPQMGGYLELLGKDKDGQPTFEKSTRIAPHNNKFIFFEVTNDSYHQVKEVLTMDHCRMSINGWFHYKHSNPYKCIPLRVPETGLYSTKRLEPLDVNVSLSDWISPQYLNAENRRQIQHQIESDSEISLHYFLVKRKYEELCGVLVSDDIQWKRVGPPNRRDYEVIDMENVPGVVSELLTVLRSKNMFALLKDYTDLDLIQNEVSRPTLRMELQRWTAGCYSLLSEYDWEAEKELDLIMYLGHSVDTIVGGQTAYLSTDEQVEDALITLDPMENVTNVIFRDTARIVKYVSKRTCLKYFYVIVCSYKE